MKIRKTVLLIVGLALLVAGILLLDKGIASVLLIIAGLSLLILGSIALMTAGGKINGLYFPMRQYDPSNQPTEKVALQNDGENVHILKYGKNFLAYTEFNLNLRLNKTACL